MFKHFSIQISPPKNKNGTKNKGLEKEFFFQEFFSTAVLILPLLF